MKSRALSLQTKLLLPGAVTLALFSLVIFFLVLPALTARFTEIKKEQMKALVDLSISSLEYEAGRMEALGLGDDEIQNRLLAQVRVLRYGPDGKDYLWVNNRQPAMVMHPYATQLNGKDLSGYLDPKGNALFVAMVKVVSEKGAGFVSYQWQYKDDASHTVPKISYVKGFSRYGWILGTGLYIEDVKAHVRATMLNISLWFILVLAVSSGVGVFFARQVLGPLRRMTSQSETLAKGEGDLTTQIKCDSKDEVGDLARHFNDFIANIRELVHQSREGAQSAQNLAAQISAQLSDHVALTDRLKGQLATLTQGSEGQNTQLGQVQQHAAGLKDQAEALYRNLSGAAEQVGHLNREQQVQTDTITAMGAAIEEQAENIRSIAEVAGKADQSSDKLVAIATEGKATLERTTGSVQKMIETTDKVGDFANIITTVASQTNLLAMNAAIEAAHAGDAGKGFAVVAEEIRKLADLSNKEARKVKGLLAEVQTVAGSAEADLTLSVNAFDEVHSESQSVSSVVRQVRHAMEEQQVANVEMVKSIGDLQKAASQVKASGDALQKNHSAMEVGASALEEASVAMTQTLTQLADASKKAVKIHQQFASGLELILSGVQEVNNQMQGQQVGMNALVESLGRFRTDAAIPEEQVLKALLGPARL